MIPPGNMPRPMNWDMRWRCIPTRRMWWVFCCPPLNPTPCIHPNITCMVNREVVGIVTQINEPKADPERAARWLRLSGCKKIFYVDSTVGTGVPDILSYLREEETEEISTNNKNNS